MLNMPTITSVEIAAIGAAVFLLYIAPVLLATIEHYRRRKAERSHAAYTLAEMTAFTAAAQPDLEEATAAVTASPIGEVAEQVAASAAPPPDTHHDPTLTAPAWEPTYEPRPVAPEEARPDAGHRFRLEDLHQARLEDWPPATIRDDAAHSQIWSEAQRVAEAHPAVFSSVLVSPCQVRSVCLGGAEKNGSRFRLCFLLFPGLWPASSDQAVSQAVFEVDSATGEVRHWIEPLR